MAAVPVDSYDGSVANATTTQGTYTTYAYGQTTSPFSTAPNSNVGYSAVLAATGTSSPTVTVTNPTVQGYVARSFGIHFALCSSRLIRYLCHSKERYQSQLSKSGSSPASVAVLTFHSLIFKPWFNTQTLPSTLPTTLNIGTPGAPTPSAYYYGGNLMLSSGQTLNINGPVILYIDGYLRTNTGTLVINSTGSAEIYFTSTLRTYVGSGGFLNRTQDPKKLFLFGDTSSSSSVYFAATANPFYGVIYMPNTTASLGLDVRTGVTLYGALSAKKITFSSEATLHYDTSLRYATFGGIDQPYAITEWRELTDPTERVVLP